MAVSPTASDGAVLTWAGLFESRQTLLLARKRGLASAERVRRRQR